MNPRRLPIGVLMILPIVCGFGLYAFTTQAEEVEVPNATATPTATVDDIDAVRTAVREAYDGHWATQTAAAGVPLSPDDEYATYIAGQPTPTPAIERHGAFHSGAWVRVNAGANDCLNARNSPSLTEEWVIINICVPDGYEGVLTGPAQQAEGRWWWYLAGMGWVAEEYLSYVREWRANQAVAGQAPNTVPELAGVAGRVAFLRGNDIWMMRPDGSDQVRLVDNIDNDPRSGRYTPPPADLTWSPDGTRLSYNVYRWDTDGIALPTVDLHILTLDDAGLVATDVHAGLGGGGWSPDGVHLGVVRGAEPPQMGGGMSGIPAILDVTTGGQLVLGSVVMYQQKPPAFNHDGTLLMVNEAIYPKDGSPGTAAIVIYTADGAAYDRVDFSAEGIGYASPAWSPVDNQIAMHISRQQGDGYIAQYQVYDVVTRTIFGDARPPKYSEKIGGGCGGGDMWNTDWSLDGTRVLYTFMWGDTGANGVWSWDLASGAQSVLYAAEAGAPTAGPDGLMMFSSNSYPDAYIFYGSADGGFPSVVTQGSLPVWYVPAD